jgi:beta-lactamase regulating signal transducer with metallopeptidase domain
MSILHMNLSAGLLVGIIVLVRAAAKEILPKQALLILWGVVLLRLLLPVSIPSPFAVYPISGDILYGLAHDGGALLSTAQERNAQISLWFILWLTGAVTVLTIFSVLFIKNHRALRFASIIKDIGFIDEWLLQSKINRSISVLQSDRITTPVAAGFLRPRIILPKSMDMTNTTLLRHVLTHEYFHIKRNDIFWKLLMAFTVCLHWFNPAVWVLFVLFNRDLELACDERVLRHLGAEKKKAYAYSLIGMAERQSGFAPLYSHFNRNTAEERVVSIMKYRKASVKTVLLAAVLLSGVLTVFSASMLTVGANGGVNAPGSGFTYTQRESPGSSRSIVTQHGSVSFPKNIEDNEQMLAIIHFQSGKVRLNPDPKGRDVNFFDIESNYMTNNTEK